ncbi:MAG: alpha/beta hydrolase [Sphingobacteriaceae bacterium]|nr:alpha/beta hydrolase [Sphingobacteriaceae bacterium]
MKVYFISGLAADRKIFSKIELPEHCSAVYLDWIPVLKGESLTQYSLRLAQKIDTKEEFSIIGLSFGGVVATEINKLYKPFKLILISSVPDKNYIPLVYRMLGRLESEKALFPWMLNRLRPILKWFFGPLSLDTENLVDEYLNNADFRLLKWSLGQIGRWKNDKLPENFIQIHGSDDRIFPASFSSVNYIVKGGHLCVYDNSNQVNAVLRNVLG